MAAAIMTRGWETPWDSNPIIGISKKLGYVFLKPDPDGAGESWVEYDPAPLLAKQRRTHDTLIVHRHDWPQLVATPAAART